MVYTITVAAQTELQHIETRKGIKKMSEKKNESDIAGNKVSRRSMLKWAGALAGVAAVGAFVGAGSDMLLRPIPEATTATVTATMTVTETPETLMTSIADGGPFYAVIKNGSWVKSAPIKPNLPVAANTFLARQRNFAADRVRYPMKRVDFDPSGNRNTQNRGKSGFVRISWDEALDMVANELKRIKDQYGPAAVCEASILHQWVGSLHQCGGSYLLYPPGESHSGWASRFWTLYGGCTDLCGGNSNPANQAGGPITWGRTATWTTNSYADVLANSKLILYWAVDYGLKSYSSYSQNYYLKQLQLAGKKQIVIDPFYNDTAAAYGCEWMSIVPNTDEAMMVAIAYVWFTESLIDEAFAKSHTVGFDEFKSYVLGVSDGVQKTPEWAEQICGVSADRIRNLAHEWVSGPTFIVHSVGGANRRDNGTEWCRLLVVLQTISGNIGLPGGGHGGLSFDTRPSTMKSFGSIPAMKTPLQQHIFHVFLNDAINNPPITWNSIGTDGEIYEYTYPKPGLPEIRALACNGGTGFTLNQNPGTPRHIAAVQNQKIEFVYVLTPWWHTAAKYSDVVLPARYIGERDDLVQWENLSIFMHTVCEPVPEARNDMDIFTGLAERLGFADKLTEGKSADQWLREFYDAGNVPMTFEEFKSVGFYEYEAPTQTASVQLKEFRADPEKNKLPTPSGKVEIYSQRMVDFYGTDNPIAPPIPKYVPPTEGFDNSRAKTYPLLMLSPHPKVGRHSQWQNVAWVRSNDQIFRDGYRAMYINPVDAAARGLKDHDLVKVYNDRGSIVCSTLITDRVMPSVLYVWEGGWYQPEEPGNYNSIDLGGNVNAVIAPRQGELTHGMVANTLVQVEKWK
jgi:trimethylamine-N-oxide reductase (cytochrome c)